MRPRRPKPKKFAKCYSYRTTRRRKLCNQAESRSVFQRWPWRVPSTGVTSCGLAGVALAATGKTSAVCHCHELRTLAPLGLADASAPFFVATKVASMKHSDKSSLPRLRRSSASASRMCLSSPPISWNRRWQTWYGGERSGKSCQRVPERNIHKMPFSICRSSLRGCPLPSSHIGGLGISGPMISLLTVQFFSAHSAEKVPSASVKYNHS